MVDDKLGVRIYKTGSVLSTGLIPYYLGELTSKFSRCGAGMFFKGSIKGRF